MSDGCMGSVVDVHIGHVVIPHASAAAAAEAAEAAVVFPSAGPAHKKARIEAVATRSSASAPADVVIATAWSEERITDALRRYAVAALEAASCEAAAGSASSPSTAAAAAAVLKAVNDAASSWVAVWPAVRLSPTPADMTGSGGEATTSTMASWSTVSFSFVPGALESTASATAKGAHAGISKATVPDAAPAVDAVTLRVLAAISLPRGLCVPYRGIATAVTAGGCAGCVSAVLTESIQIRAATATPPAASSSVPHSPASRSAASPCTYGMLPAELRARPIFVVGAGGIGCEVLKVLVLSGFTQVHLIDLDTIDATNLNRQFLFRVADVGNSKADTARRAVLDWFAAADDPAPEHVSDLRGRRTPPSIVAYHDNVKADRYDDAFYRQFAVVLSALDNVSARQHVNRMCMRNNIPLIESGTMGYNGQAQPILKNVFECYDCRPKPPETRTFAVCTIHARPTTMVHCVHYAKELYEVLFGSDSSDMDGKGASALSDVGATAEAGSGSATPLQVDKQQHGATRPTDGGELSYLRAMVSDWRRRQLPAASPGCTGAPTCALAEASSTLGHNDVGDRSGREGSRASSAAALALELLRLLFVTKVEELLSLKTSWPTEPPEPLSRRDVDRVAAAHISANATGASPAPLSGDHVLSVQDCMELFVRAVTQCLARPTGLTFRKEDDAATSFVSATANMRAHVFHIAEQSLEDVRSIAGSIIPAIATTNATIAGAVVHELISLLRSSSSSFSQPASTSAAQMAPLSQAEVTGVSAPVSMQTSPRAHVVYTRKVPQVRRRRVPLPPGQRYTTPALFMEYAGDDAPSANESASKLAAPCAPLQAALALVGAEDSTAYLPRMSGAAEGGGKARRSVAVMDHYLVHSTAPNPPNRLHCGVCQDVHPEVCVTLDLRSATLGQLAHLVLESALGLEAPSVSYGSTMLYEDEDYEELADHILADVLQLPPAEAGGVAHQRQSYTLTADALNKDVPWSVVLTHDDKGAATSAPSPSTVFFQISGLEEAKAAEERALARLAAQQAQQEPPAEEDEEEALGAPPGTTGLASSAAATTAPVAVEFIVSDDDEVLDVTPATNAPSNVAAKKDIVLLD
ncbi:ubiquitin-activating enzyme-like protein [Leishmania donovani]|uniref:Ubiquitin-activating enzyme-like protein n=1 Tax=Leishmania donovani TaxID=5661 RepID=E9B9C8_LEIDO|nr:ubiquitin-activating enzyme-like protein [Leishmania donovani]CBZ31867.1 ubiquitin-activating enzyme-like protein [Leishmania donovani]